jgi:hypothetical protein
MKQFIFLLLIASITISLHAQDRTPRKVKKAFEAQYPEAKDATWSSTGERAKEMEYRAEYTLQGGEQASNYDYKGNWLITIIFIEIDELPDAVTKEIDEEYMNARLLRAARLEEPELSSYGVALEYLDNRMEIQYREDGRMIRRRLRSEGFGL